MKDHQCTYKATQMSMKRIKREILDIQKEDLGDIVLKPTERSMYEWTGSIPGPSGSPYAGGVFHLSIHLPNEYRACLLLGFATSDGQC